MHKKDKKPTKKDTTSDTTSSKDTSYNSEKDMYINSVKDYLSDEEPRNNIDDVMNPHPLKDEVIESNIAKIKKDFQAKQQSDNIILSQKSISYSRQKKDECYNGTLKECIKFNDEFLNIKTESNISKPKKKKESFDLQ